MVVRGKLDVGRESTNGSVARMFLLKRSERRSFTRGRRQGGTSNIIRLNNGESTRCNNGPGLLGSRLQNNFVHLHYMVVLSSVYVPNIYELDSWFLQSVALSFGASQVAKPKKYALGWLRRRDAAVHT